MRRIWRIFISGLSFLIKAIHTGQLISGLQTSATQQVPCICKSLPICMVYHLLSFISTVKYLSIVEEIFKCWHVLGVCSVKSQVKAFPDSRSLSRQEKERKGRDLCRPPTRSFMQPQTTSWVAETFWFSKSVSLKMWNARAL